MHKEEDSPRSFNKADDSSEWNLFKIWPSSDIADILSTAPDVNPHSGQRGYLRYISNLSEDIREIMLLRLDPERGSHRKEFQWIQMAMTL